MFVRWKKRQRKRKWWDLEEKYSLYAYLIESYRDESGQPRQRYLTYLGSIRADQELTSWIVAVFWKTANTRLDKLELSGDQRIKIESKLEEIVPRPSDELMKHSATLFKKAISI